MFQKRLAALCIATLVSLCSFASAQDQPASNFAAPKLELTDFSIANSVSSSGSNSLSTNGDGFIRTIPVPQTAGELPSAEPFHSLAIGFTANTLGAGVEMATPLSRSFNLRSSFNFLSFTYPFSHDGVNYNAKVQFQSSISTLDWFPRHRDFYISPGILYFKNAVNAGASVGPGQYFVLGGQGFVNSIDDPLTGSATIVFPHQLSPLLMIGFGNIIPRSGRHFSFPSEIGVAYTGAPVVNVNLNGTACTAQGCVDFAANPDMQSSLKQEVSDLNEVLKRIPVYPILSLGFAYHF